MNNTTMTNTTLNTTGTGDFSGGNITLQPIIGTAEFMPLSQRPIALGQTMPHENPADLYVLEKQTPVSSDKEESKVQKDLDCLIPESEEMMKVGLQQARHSSAISSELKLLLENEKKVLSQMMKRCNKFSQLKEENKQMSEDWHNKHKKILPNYEKNQLKLMNYLTDHPMNEEEISDRVQQKILFEIVSRTVASANNILVQLSMENTIVNDIDLSLLDLKKHGAVMLNQISEWLKMMETQDQHQMTVLERWAAIRQNLKDIKNKSKLDENGTSGLPQSQVKAIMRCYEDRLQRLEQALQQCCNVATAALPTSVYTNFC